MADRYRIIKTYLRGQKYNNILHSVIGQMSDGIWENGNIYGYWVPVEISDNNDILVDKDHYVSFAQSTYKNGFYGKSDSEVKKYFATKIKAVVNIEQKYYPNRNLRWSSTNHTILKYMHSYDYSPSYNDSYGLNKSRNNITVADCWNAYQILMMDSQRPKAKKSATPIAKRTLATPKSQYIVTNKVYENSMKLMKKR